MDNKQITLIANDDSKHIIDSLPAKRSIFINDLLIDFDTDHEDKIEIKINEANGAALKEIIEYLEYYKDKEPKPIKKPMQMDDKLENLLDKWDYDFVQKNKDLQRMQDLIVASDYMRITSLHELLCCYIASVMKDLGTADAIIKHFGIEEDITEEEMKKMEKEELEAQKLRRQEEFKKRREQQEEEYKKAQEHKAQADSEEIVDTKEKVETKEEDKP